MVLEVLGRRTVYDSDCAAHPRHVLNVLRPVGQCRLPVVPSVPKARQREMQKRTRPGAMTATWIQLTTELLSWPMMFLGCLVRSSVLIVSEECYRRPAVDVQPAVVDRK